jgi:hypothetical protein
MKLKVFAASVTLTLVILSIASVGYPPPITDRLAGFTEQGLTNLIQSISPTSVAYATQAGGLTNDGVHATSLIGVDTNQATIFNLSGTNKTLTLGVPLYSSSTLSPTGGLVFQGKASFTTDFTNVQSIQIYCCNGTNQTITLLDATNSTPWQIYRFSSTNGYGKFTLTTARADQYIRETPSNTLTQIGIGEIGVYHDGHNWWLASKAKTIFPNASWSLWTNQALLQNVITNIPFNQLEYNNSQGIALVAPGKFYITNNGQYLFTFSAQIQGGANKSDLSIWLRQSGVDVPRSRTKNIFGTTETTLCMTVNYIVNVSTNNTFFELYAASSGTTGLILSEAANPGSIVAPVAPGCIVTINRVSDSWP